MRLFLIAMLLLAACQPEPDDADAMRQQHDGETPTPTAATDGAATADVSSERVTYATVGGEPVEGVLVRPARAERNRITMQGVSFGTTTGFNVAGAIVIAILVALYATWW